MNQILLLPPQNTQYYFFSITLCQNFNLVKCYKDLQFSNNLRSFRFLTLCTSWNTLVHILYTYYILTSYAPNSIQEGTFPKLLTAIINFNTISLVSLAHLTQSNTKNIEWNLQICVLKYMTLPFKLFICQNSIILTKTLITYSGIVFITWKTFNKV